MADWRSFAATSEPDTCLWCGRKLRRPTVTDTSLISERDAFAARRRGERVPSRPMYAKPGDYGDGWFCGLRCAYLFAVRLADAGHRLVGP